VRNGFGARHALPRTSVMPPAPVARFYQFHCSLSSNNTFVIIWNTISFYKLSSQIHVSSLPTKQCCRLSICTLPRLKNVSTINYLYFMTFLRQTAASRCEGFPTIRELTSSPSSHLDAAVCPRNFLRTLMSLFCSAGLHLENQCCQTKLTAMLPTREQTVLNRRQKYS
jgi:hypothetical protein